MRIKIKLFPIIFIIGNLLCSTRLLEAGIGVKPTTVEMVVSPGRVTKGVYAIVNEGSETTHVNVDIEDWLKVKTGLSTIPIEKWLTITPMEFDIEPQEVKEVEYLIDPPLDHKGELVAMIFFGTSSQMEGAFGIVSRIGVIVYAAMEGTIDLRCSIADVTVIRAIQEKKEGGTIDKGVIFTIDVENQGNVHIRPTGDITVTDKDKNTYNVKVERGFPVFPGKRLDYAINWDKKDLSPGKYEVLIRLDCGNIYSIDKTIERRMTFTVKKDGKISF